MNDYDVIVVGGGIVGLWSAYNLCKIGKKTLLLEQFPLPHSRGSSHGQSRGVRYINGPEYISKMMPEAYKMWRSLQTKSNTQFFMDSGTLMIFDQNDKSVDHMIKYAKEQFLPFEYLTGTEASTRYPGLKLDDTLRCVLDPHGAIVNPDKCIPVLISEIKSMGGTIVDGCAVDNITPLNDERVIVSSKNGQFTAKSLIIACGPWTNKVLIKTGIQLPLKSVRITIQYFKEIGNDQVYKLGKFPSISDFSGSVKTYSIPAYEYPGMMKLCYFGGVECDPDMRDKRIGFSENYKRRRLEEMRKEKLDQYPKLDPNSCIEETCMYTNTPDMNFIIDRHPKFSNIVFGAGFSGSGFKTAPTVGRILARMSNGKEGPEYLDSISIKRFKTKSHL